MDECISSLKVCKSVDILQAIRWTAIVWNEVSKTTVVKCFIKAGILDSEGDTNAVDSSGNDVDPFPVQDLANKTNENNTVSLRQGVDGCLDAPFCQELSDNWEDIFFRQVGREENHEDYNDEVEEVLAVQELSSMQDALDFLKQKGN